MSESTRASDRMPLDEQLARLGREVAPRTDLWPAIERRIVRRGHGTWPLALAASIAAVGVAIWLGSSRLHERATQSHVEAAPAAPVAALFDEPSDPRFQAARATLLKAFGERLALLDPKSRAAVESSLAQIRASRADLQHALAANPEDPVLLQLLASSWYEEFDLYEDIVEDTQLARN